MSGYTLFMDGSTDTVKLIGFNVVERPVSNSEFFFG